MTEPRRVIAVIMAKEPIPGTVKTRLVGPGPMGDITPITAAEVARAMADCVHVRLSEIFGRGNVILARTPAETETFGHWPMTVDQGSGDLGLRLSSVWRLVHGFDPHAAVAFFGIDSPDVPLDALRRLHHGLGTGAAHLAALGRSMDGGFWTFGVAHHHSALLSGIDWGSADVYDQTATRISNRGLQLLRLADWYDVDTSTDVVALLDRIWRSSEPALIRLSVAIRRILAQPAASETRSTETRMTSEPAKPTDASNDRQFAGCHLLIVDDNSQNIELLEAYLASLKCRVSSAADGVDALAAVQQKQPDLILLDVMMPRMSGFEVCQRLKTDPATRDIPILMVTALNEVGDVERGAEAGTDDFLSKPFNKIELLTRVRSLLRIRLLKRELDQKMGRADTNRSTDLDEQTSPGF